jgi:hypothetical protein
MKAEGKRVEVTRTWVRDKDRADEIVTLVARQATRQGNGHRVHAEQSGGGYAIIVTGPAEEKEKKEGQSGAPA